MLPRGQAPLKVQRTEQKPRSLAALVAAVWEALGGFLRVVDTGLCLDKKLDSGAGPPPPKATIAHAQRCLQENRVLFLTFEYGLEDS